MICWWFHVTRGRNNLHVSPVPLVVLTAPSGDKDAQSSVTATSRKTLTADQSCEVNVQTRRRRIFDPGSCGAGLVVDGVDSGNQSAWCRELSSPQFFQKKASRHFKQSICVQSNLIFILHFFHRVVLGLDVWPPCWVKVKIMVACLCGCWNQRPSQRCVGATEGRTFRGHWNAPSVL